MNYKILGHFAVVICCAVNATAQVTDRTKTDQCGTMQRLENKFIKDPNLKIQFEERRSKFNRALRDGSYTIYNRNSRENNSEMTQAVYMIPVVFHIVMPNPSVVTDQQIMAQLDTLNRDFAGLNGDSYKIPSYFRSSFGNTAIQFCLAQRTPTGENTTGIERIQTTRTSFSNTNDGVKHVSSGGADIWPRDKYYNIWICPLANGVVGYSSLPDDGQNDEQGVVVDYRALPGGSYPQFSSGKTVTHETGHFFNLYHIWGDDDGACTGTDFIDDTPNQASASRGCNTLIKNDVCTPGGNGIMYQNFMDYSDDVCMLMFTNQQVSRMESALMVYHSALLNSDGCLPSIVRNYDVQLNSITEPSSRLCVGSFTPVISIRNRGTQTVTSLTIRTRIDNGDISTFNWVGSLAKSANANVILSPMSTATGNHALTIYLSQPNNNADEDPTNDTLTLRYEYYEAVNSLSEGFEDSKFPVIGWDVINPDNLTTWKRVTGIGKTGNASIMIDNFNYTSNGQKDDLRLPDLAIPNVDSAFLSFQVAASTSSSLGTVVNTWDTLEVLVSTDCGRTYTSLYKKYGSNLVTRNSSTIAAFVPTSNEWRKDSINLASYIGGGPVIIAFRNTTENENNIYLDDVNLRTVIINKNLKEQGFLVTPNPTGGSIAVQFYPQPANLRAVQLFNISGQKIAETRTDGQASNYYSFDLGRFSAGTYIVRAIFSDKVLTKKIIKY